jgi:hypothetical protein
MDVRPPRVAHGEPPAGHGKALPAGPEQAPGTAVHEGKAGVAEPAGKGEEGTKPKPSRRRSVRRSDQPTRREPSEEAAPGRVPTEDERLAVEPAEMAAADRNNRIGALDWEEAMVMWLDSPGREDHPNEIWF